MATGESGNPRLAQDRSSLGGKILRINPDGSIPSDNPDPASPVWSFGHRNIQGLAWDSAGRLWVTEYGANRLDELNLIQRGGNYGWPMAEGRADTPGLIDPAIQWATGEASPSGTGILRRLAVGGVPSRSAALPDTGRRRRLTGRSGTAVCRTVRAAAHRCRRTGRRAVVHHQQPRRSGKPARRRRPDPAVPALSLRKRSLCSARPAPTARRLLDVYSDLYVRCWLGFGAGTRVGIIDQIDRFATGEIRCAF